MLAANLSREGLLRLAEDALGRLHHHRVGAELAEEGRHQVGRRLGEADQVGGDGDGVEGEQLLDGLAHGRLCVVRGEEAHRAARSFVERDAALYARAFHRVDEVLRLEAKVRLWHENDPRFHADDGANALEVADEELVLRPRVCHAKKEKMPLFPRRGWVGGGMQARTLGCEGFDAKHLRKHAMQR